MTSQNGGGFLHFEFSGITVPLLETVTRPEVLKTLKDLVISFNKEKSRAWNDPKSRAVTYSVLHKLVCWLYTDYSEEFIVMLVTSVLTLPKSDDLTVRVVDHGDFLAVEATFDCHKNKSPLMLCYADNHSYTNISLFAAETHPKN